MFRKVSISLALALWLNGVSADADPVTLDHPDGTTHAYDLIFTPAMLTWDEAKVAAEAQSFNGVQGHLATITSAKENDVLSHFGTDEEVPYWNWLGGSQTEQPPGQTNPTVGWHWVTGEPWNYTNWFAGEPNDADHPVAQPGHAQFGEENNQENFLTFDRRSALLGTWNDYTNWGSVTPTNVKSYLVEFDGVAVPEPCSAILLVLSAGVFALYRRALGESSENC